MWKPDLFRLPFPVRRKLVEALIGLKAMKPTGMAAYAARHTAFYRHLYEGLDTSLFEELPVLEKRIVLDVNPYDLLSDEERDSVCYYGETTWSTGSPTPAFYTPLEFAGARLLALVSPHFERMRPALKENRTCLNGLAFGFTIAGMSFGNVFESLGCLVANVGSRSTLATPSRIARAIGRLKPGVMAATPIDFLSWMRILQEDHPDRYDEAVESLRILVSTAELCDRSRVAAIASHFSLTHVDVYACVEGFFTLPCTCGEKHVLPAYHVELFDPNLKPLGTTGTGRMAFTNLVKRSTPMVRYLLDDWVTVSESDCPMGFGLSIVPHGRAELNVVIDDETINVEQVEEALFRHGLFGDYRARIHDDRIELTIEQYTDEDPPVDALSAGFEERFGLSTRVTVVPFGEITEYREVRGRKPILKMEDLRSTSTQEVPEFL